MNKKKYLSVAVFFLVWQICTTFAYLSFSMQVVNLFFEMIGVDLSIGLDLATGLSYGLVQFFAMFATMVVIYEAFLWSIYLFGVKIQSRSEIGVWLGSFFGAETISKENCWGFASVNSMLPPFLKFKIKQLVDGEWFT